MKPTLKTAAFVLVASMLALPSLAQTSTPAASPAAPTKAVTAKTEAPKAQAPKAEATKAPKADTTKAHVAKELIDLNSATVEQLVSLPAVGKKNAAKIVAGRPYKSTSELTSKKILSAADFAKIEKKITVKQ